MYTYVIYYNVCTFTEPHTRNIALWCVFFFFFFCLLLYIYGNKLQTPVDDSYTIMTFLPFVVSRNRSFSFVRFFHRRDTISLSTVPSITRKKKKRKKNRKHLPCTVSLVYTCSLNARGTSLGEVSFRCTRKRGLIQ